MNRINIKRRNLANNNKNLRTIGDVPGVIYGPSISNFPVKLTQQDLSKALMKDGEVYEIETSRGSVYVKFDELQRDPLTGKYIHFSLLEMPKGEENEIDIPVDLKGVPVGVKKGGVLVVLRDQISVNGKPSKIPKHLECNVSKLDIGDKLTVSDLRFPKKIQPAENSEEVIAVCKPPVKVVETNLDETNPDEMIDNSEIIHDPRASIA